MKLRYESARKRAPEIRIINYAKRTAMAWSRPLKLTGTWAPRVPRPRRLLGFLWSVPVGLQLSLVYAVLVTVTLALLGWALYAQLDGFLVQNTAERLDRLTRPVPVGPGPFVPGRDFGS